MLVVAWSYYYLFVYLCRAKMKTMSENTVQSHHHTHHRHRHRHHRSSRSYLMKRAVKRGLVYGLATTALCVTIVIVNFGMTGREDLMPTLLRYALPFIGAGLFVWLAYYLCQRLFYYLQHRKD